VAHRGGIVPSVARVVITAVGATTPLGGSITAAAGLRAGLTRPSELDDWKVVDEESGESVPIHGHAVEAVAGFHGAGRLAFLAALGLADLKRSLPEPAGRIHLILGIPDLGDRFLATEEMPSQERRDAEEEFRAERQSIAARAIEHAGLAFHQSEVHVLAISAAGFSSALELAQKLLESRTCDRCLVGAVDSFIDSDTLEMLSDDHRLKDPETTTGVVPGEASAFLCLELAGTRAAPAPLVLAQLGLVARGETQDHRTAERPPNGVPWADAALSTLRQGGEPPFFLVDHSGESHRAQEWGEALVRLAAHRVDLASAVNWYPAIGFGEVGAAFSPLAMVLACRAWSRRYAPASSAIVMAASEEGQRAAIRIDSPGMVPQA
jgi:3-oxoacyl-[acyl-carrier-protein] synthase I